MRYENKCKDCNEIYITTRMVEDRYKDIVCPNCNSTNYERLISVPTLLRSGEMIPPSGFDEYLPKDGMPIIKKPDEEVKALKKKTKEDEAKAAKVEADRIDRYKKNKFFT